MFILNPHSKDIHSNINKNKNRDMYMGKRDIISTQENLAIFNYTYNAEIIIFDSTF